MGPVGGIGLLEATGCGAAVFAAAVVVVVGVVGFGTGAGAGVGLVGRDEEEDVFGMDVFGAVGDGVAGEPGRGGTERAGGGPFVGEMAPRDDCFGSIVGEFVGCFCAAGMGLILGGPLDAYDIVVVKCG